MKLFNSKKDKEFRRSLRRKLAEPERLLWSRIRAKQLGVKFRRQVSIDIYVVDFYCPAKKLVIEIDGDSHYSQKEQVRDAQRDRTLQGIGLHVLRFDNQQVRNNIEGVLASIKSYLDQNPL